MIDAGVGLRAHISKKNLKSDIQECLAKEIFAELITAGQKLLESVLAANRADQALDRYRMGEF